MFEQIGLNRDKAMLARERNAMFAGESVMTVTGYGHFVTQLPAYDNVFHPQGTPVAKCGSDPSFLNTPTCP